jgi:6-phosphogluconolactonase (cycloisomerase 2 family)
MHLIGAAPFAAMLGLCGCGAGSDGMGTRAPPPAVAYAYVSARPAAAASPGAVYEYAVLGDGSLSALTPASIAAGLDPAAVAVDQASRYVYVVNVGDGTISQYAIQADNSLAPMNPATVANPGMKTLGINPSAAQLDPSASFLYVTNAADDTVSQFRIGSDGQLTPLTPATVAAGTTPMAIATGFGGGGPAYVYVANSGLGVVGGTGSVSQYAIGADGTLTPLAPASIALTGSPVAVGIHASTAYVMNNCVGSNCTGSITPFAIGADGTLTPTGAPITTGGHYDSISLLVDPGGEDAYLLSNLMGVDTASGALWQLGVSSNGALTAASAPTLTLAPSALAQSLNDATLYVLTANNGTGGSGGTGGSVNAYTLTAGAAPTLSAATPLAAAQPVSMGMVILFAP